MWGVVVAVCRSVRRPESVDLLGAGQVEAVWAPNLWTMSPASKKTTFKQPSYGIPNNQTSVKMVCRWRIILISYCKCSQNSAYTSKHKTSFGSLFPFYKWSWSSGEGTLMFPLHQRDWILQLYSAENRKLRDHGFQIPGYSQPKPPSI